MPHDSLAEWTPSSLPVVEGITGLNLQQIIRNLMPSMH